MSYSYNPTSYCPSRPWWTYNPHQPPPYYGTWDDVFCGRRYGRGGDSNDPSVSVLRVNNDTSVAADFQLRTPGGVFILAKKPVSEDDTEDVSSLKSVYDIVIQHNGQTKTINNVRIAENVEIKVSSIIAGDYEGIPRDFNFKQIHEDSLLKDFLTGDVLNAFVAARQVSPDDKLYDVIAKTQGDAKPKGLEGK